MVIYPYSGTVALAQGQCDIKHDKSADVCVLRVSDGAESLPRHPAGGRGRFVLSASAAELVCMPIHLPPHADPGCAHAAVGTTRSGRVLVTVVWFRPEAADAACGWAAGKVAAARGRVEMHMAGRKSAAGGMHGAGQRANGAYLELGVGIMAGKGRGSVDVDGQRSVRPFSRNARQSDLLEGDLGVLMGAAGRVFVECFGPEPLRAEGSCVLGNAFQYPRTAAGCPEIRSHQVAIRCADWGGGAEPDRLTHGHVRRQGRSPRYTRPVHVVHRGK
jgi:hypothetical protein